MPDIAAYIPSVILIMLSASALQSSIGFGGALLAVPLLSPMLGLRTTTAFFTLCGVLNGAQIVFSYRHGFHWRDVRLLILGSLFGILIGVRLLTFISQTAMLFALGIIILTYVILTLWQVKFRVLRRKRWALALGMASGVLTGAYNTGGPPLVIYAAAQDWDGATFKANLQSVVIIGGLFTTLNHAMIGNLTGVVWAYFLICIPVIFTGNWLGHRLSRRLNPILFRRIVLIALLIIGLKLLLENH